MDPAGWEIAGHIVLKREQDYATVTQAWAWRLLSFASCDEARFAKVAAIALGGGSTKQEGGGGDAGSGVA